MLAVLGLFALVLAALSGSTPLALVVIALAAAGIVQLVRDGRPGPAPGPGPAAVAVAVEPAPEPEPPVLSADEFTPDISTDPDGPSSDARADHV